MRTFVNDFEPHIFIHRLSPESQCSADSVLSFGNVASRLPISTHSFEWQLTKETLVTTEEMTAKSEIVTIRYLNLIIGDDAFASNDGFISTVDEFSSIINYLKILYKS
jgi:hypothetical protein